MVAASAALWGRVKEGARARIPRRRGAGLLAPSRVGEYGASLREGAGDEERAAAAVEDDEQQVQPPPRRSVQFAPETAAITRPSRKSSSGGSVRLSLVGAVDGRRDSEGSVRSMKSERCD